MPATMTEEKKAMGEAENTLPAGRRRAGRACPICGRPASAEVRPFCSRRCADVDLARWLGVAYRVPVDDPEAGEVDAGGTRDDEA